MSILENASEIDRLYRLHDKTERDATKFRKLGEEARRSELQAKGICDGALARIEVLFDGMAASVPSNVEEALGLAVLLNSMTDASVFLQDDTDARKRADRIISSLIIGLNRLSVADRLPQWFEEHIRGAENGCPSDPDLDQPSANENGQSSHH